MTAWLLQLYDYLIGILDGMLPLDAGIYQRESAMC